MRITVEERNKIAALVNGMLWDRFRGWVAVDEQVRAEQLGLIESRLVRGLVDGLDLHMGLIAGLVKRVKAPKGE